MSAPQPADPFAGQPYGPRRREPVFNLPGVVIALIAGCVLVHLVRTYVLTADQDWFAILRLAFIPLRYQDPVDIYWLTTPVTYAFLHGSFAHLLINMVWLAAFGSPLAHRLGSVRFLVFWIGTGVAAALLHYVLHAGDLSPLVGASGAISGMMGAAARFGFRIDRRADRPAFYGPLLPVSRTLSSRTVITFLAVWFVVNLVTGLASFVPGETARIAWEAHIGGFLAGFIGIALVDRRPE